MIRPLVLASASPQRRAILEDAGFEFTVLPANVEEETHGEPAEVAELNARRKATAIPGSLVLGADTVVALDGDILGKPADEAAAREYLRRLNGRTHEVVGAIALAQDGEVTATAVEVTRVAFTRHTDEEIDAYVATGEWVGRAGGYAIQESGGSRLVEWVDGDYLNVVGLPLARLEELLASR
ncbi:MAG TPA: Maf family protein [Solirubrobacteraceae bacterium]|nr:Maf family protein [Solirubrobacteraceae bacterium]